MYGSRYAADGTRKAGGGGGGPRSHSRYVRQDDDIKMDAVPRRQHHLQGNYDARVTAAAAGGGYSAGEYSDDDILPPPPPPPRGIKIQTDITVR